MISGSIGVPVATGVENRTAGVGFMWASRKDQDVLAWLKSGTGSRANALAALSYNLRHPFPGHRHE